jgi:hypothetical protein
MNQRVIGSELKPMTIVETARCWSDAVALVIDGEVISPPLVSDERYLSIGRWALG